VQHREALLVQLLDIVVTKELEVEIVRLENDVREKTLAAVIETNAASPVCQRSAGPPRPPTSS
jgi:hypothetical protein